MKCLIFDAGGVLVYPRLGEWHIPYRAAEILGPARAADIGTDRFRAAQARCMPWLAEDRLVPDMVMERQLRRGFVLELDRRMGWRMTDAEIDAMTDDFTDNRERYGVFDDVDESLDRWRGRYTLGILSDAMPSLPVFLEQFGLLDRFAGAVFSTEIGATKPEPRMYRAILEALDADPADCLFIDDRDVNVLGARKAGMAAVQMSRPAFPAAALWDGPVAHSFSEIDKMLEEGAL